MKGCARSCLLWLIGWAAAGGAFYFYLRQFGILEAELYWAAGGAGLCTALAVSYIIGIGGFAKERSMLLGAMTGQPPNDGEWVAVSGTIRSVNPLRTPITAMPAVAYEYDIYRIESSGGRNSSSSKQSYYQGKALAPSTITTRQGGVRLLAVPTLDVPNDDIMTEEGTINAVQYVSETRFQSFSMPKSERIGMEHEMTDDDGMFRVDKKIDKEPPVDIADCSLSERFIKQGETVCAFGLYSAARGGLIPHPNWAKQARLMRGDATAVAGQLRSRMIKYTIGILFFGGASFGIVKLYMHFARLQ
ncbi:MAG: hypothetical protein M3P06_04045 [Acidobacteriota bacterium]|nr:hypothetical protein [Acidobacteriota bacterium]